MTSRIKKGDTVVVISGKDKSREGKVLKVYPRDQAVLVEGVAFRKRHQRPRRAGEKGSIVQLPTPIPSARVMVKCPHCTRPVRVGVRVSAEGVKARICKKCGQEF
jgi:large subunit ribosomal protein L24